VDVIRQERICRNIFGLACSGSWFSDDDAFREARTPALTTASEPS
jgi:hypothetical protein